LLAEFTGVIFRRPEVRGSSGAWNFRLLFFRTTLILLILLLEKMMTTAPSFPLLNYSNGINNFLETLL